MRLPGLLPVLAALALALRCAAHKTPLRGLDPALAHHYTGRNDSFTCIDGAPTIPFVRVNDDYCDCPDGSDEPGTSACPVGRFHCRNRGHVAATIPAAFVDDGICDCCDGSDEIRGCPNKCIEHGKRVLAELRGRLKAYEVGLKLRGDHIGANQGRRGEWEREAADLEAKFVGQEKAVEAAKAKKAELEMLEHERREAEKAAADGPPGSGGEGELGESVVVEGGGKGAGGPGAGQGQGEGESGDGGSGEGGDAEDGAEEFVVGKEGDGGAEAGVEGEGDGKAGGLEGEIEEEEEDDDEEGEEDDGGDDGSGSGDESKGRNKPKKEKTEVQKAQEEVRKEEREMDRLSRELDEVKTKLDRDYGPENEFLYLAGNCYDAVENQYTYSICPFDKATQKEGSHSTNLGRHRGFEDDYRKLVFDKGQKCWQGPDRKMVLSLECGAEEKLVDVQEPSRCEYSARLQTSAACSNVELAAIKQQVAELEAQLEGHDPTEL
ncbi:unnamed protein product [Ostreobium quekettii]|uniref:Glucosidase 2 subunit beta n=1 Tax=Ostreobium quekettii TaxID=121088 RepID=A0A8S1IZN6_9CHLO|nr:unnamed protein product [Ostreobium quekettii]CAD7700840.1 unnamed protein product [Ostreobium quekettii]CAD7704712.1 unnamed protein product [Ostreobium quekettii]|eukprot:evm.model.scf_63.4 EVM.evm.TU.scf_63.4   scf_63:31832-33463(+)